MDPIYNTSGIGDIQPEVQKTENAQKTKLNPANSQSELDKSRIEKM